MSQRLKVFIQLDSSQGFVQIAVNYKQIVIYGPCSHKVKLKLPAHIILWKGIVMI